MTPVRIQPLSASTAMLAAEHARLDRAKAELEKEIAEMNAAQVPSGDDLIRALAEEIAAEEARTAEKREALARAEAALGTQARERRAAAEERRRQEVAADRQRLVDAEESVLRHVGEAQANLRAFAASFNEALAAHKAAREAAVRLSGGARVPMGFSVSDVIDRLAGGLVWTLSKLKIPGALPGATPRIGPIELPTSPYAVDVDWRSREARVIEPAVRELINNEERI